MKFDERLIKLRKQQGMSQEELADKLKVSRQAVSRWEQGLTLPDAINLLAISDMFSVTIDFLLKDNCENNEDFTKAVQSKKESHYSKNRILILMLVAFICWSIAAACNLVNVVLNFLEGKTVWGCIYLVLVVINVALAVASFVKYIMLVKDK